MKLAQLAILFAVISASPLAILPAKKSFFSLSRTANRSNEPETFKENVLVSVIMVVFCYLAAVCVKDIGSVISIAGATVNPFIGFLFPIIFYLRLD